MGRFLSKLHPGVVSAVVTAAVLYYSLFPHPAGAEYVMLFEGIDKVFHFVMYFVMAGAYIFDYALYRYPRGMVLAVELLIVALVIAIGGVIEVVQGLSGYRSADILDFAADAAGAVAAYLLMKFCFLPLLLKYFTHAGENEAK